MQKLLSIDVELLMTVILKKKQSILYSRKNFIQRKRKNIWEGINEISVFYHIVNMYIGIC